MAIGVYAVSQHANAPASSKIPLTLSREKIKTNTAFAVAIFYGIGWSDQGADNHKNVKTMKAGSPAFRWFPKP